MPFSFFSKIFLRLCNMIAKYQLSFQNRVTIYGFAKDGFKVHVQVTFEGCASFTVVLSDHKKETLYFSCFFPLSKLFSTIHLVIFPSTPVCSFQKLLAFFFYWIGFLNAFLIEISQFFICFCHSVLTILPPSSNLLMQSCFLWPQCDRHCCFSVGHVYVFICKYWSLW